MGYIEDYHKLKIVRKEKEKWERKHNKELKSIDDGYNAKLDDFVPLPYS